MTYDIRLTPEQLHAVAAWSEEGETMAAVELRRDGDILIASQGDELAAWLPDGGVWTYP